MRRFAVYDICMRLHYPPLLDLTKSCTACGKARQNSGQKTRGPKDWRALQQILLVQGVQIGKATAQELRSTSSLRCSFLRRRVKLCKKIPREWRQRMTLSTLNDGGCPVRRTKRRNLMVWRMQQEEVKERAPLLRCQSGTQLGSRSRSSFFGKKHCKRQCRDSRGYMMSKCIETPQSVISSPAPREAQDLSRHCHPGEEV